MTTMYSAGAMLAMMAFLILAEPGRCSPYASWEHGTKGAHSDGELNRVYQSA